MRNTRLATQYWPEGLWERVQAQAGRGGVSRFVVAAVVARVEELEAVDASSVSEAEYLELGRRAEQAVTVEPLRVVAEGLGEVVVSDDGWVDYDTGPAEVVVHEVILEPLAFGQCPGCGGFETGQVSARGWRCSGCGTMFTP